jgi:biopolymer transport protein ExbD
MSTTTVSSPAIPAADLNVTPLIDILLVLLTMLILTVPLLTHAVKIDLPVGAPAQARPFVDVEIDSDGRVFWNGTPVPDDQTLADWFSQAGRADPQPNVKIWPDKRGRYERVAQVMAAAQRSGVAHMALAPTGP